MEEPGKKFGGLFKSSDPDLNIPVTGGQSGIVSPYLNFDSRYIQQNSDQFIFPEGAQHQRGRFEMAFAQIGGSVFAGGALGAANGLYSGIRDTKELAGTVKRTQMLNMITKQGASSAQAIGVIDSLRALSSPVELYIMSVSLLLLILAGCLLLPVMASRRVEYSSSAQPLTALMYSIFGVGLSLARGSDDEINTLTAGTATGLLFKSSAGLKGCLRGGGIGFTAAAVYCLFTSPRIRSSLVNK